VPRELYQDRARRDARAKELRALGFSPRRRSARNQLLHPEYVKDWEGEVRTGFGNDQYRTWFKALYIVEW